jgi:hypothetical protein
MPTDPLEVPKLEFATMNPSLATNADFNEVWGLTEGNNSNQFMQNQVAAGNVHFMPTVPIQKDSAFGLNKEATPFVPSPVNPEQKKEEE